MRMIVREERWRRRGRRGEGGGWLDDEDGERGWVEEDDGWSKRMQYI